MYNNDFDFPWVMTTDGECVCINVKQITKICGDWCTKLTVYFSDQHSIQIPIAEWAKIRSSIRGAC
jgi:hypothetical protein